MPRYYNRNHGRGHNNNNNNARGRGQGRGGGRGRGSADRAEPTPRRNRYAHVNAEFDVDVQQWAPEPDVNANKGNRRRKGAPNRSRSGTGTPTPSRGQTRLPSGSGRGERGRGNGGRGRGRGARGSGRPYAAKTGPLRKDAPLSGQLYAERPLLRPVKFVRATLTPFLFEQSEDVLKPASSDVVETSNVPTADRVARLFHDDNGSDSGSESDELEEIDFTNMAQVRAEIDAIARTTATANGEVELEEVDFADLATIRAQVDAVRLHTPSVHVEQVFTGVIGQAKDATQEGTLPTHDGTRINPSIEISNELDAEFSLQDLDTNTARPSDSPATPPIQSNPESFPHTLDASSSRGPEDGISDACTINLDECIQALCASNNNSRPLDAVTPPILSNDPTPPADNDVHPLFVIDTNPTQRTRTRSASDVILIDRTGNGNVLGDDEDDEERIVYVAPHPRSRPPSGPVSPRDVLPRVERPSRTKEADGEEAYISLAGLGHVPDVTGTKAAKRARKKQANLRRKRERKKKREAVETRRYGSDIDWGSDRGEDGKDDEGMEIDPDLDLDMSAMEQFVASMRIEGPTDDAGGQDERDDAGSEEESANSLEESGSDSDAEADERVDDEEEEVFNKQEGELIGESSSDSSDEEEQSPNTRFQRRLNRLRQNSRPPPDVREDEDELEPLPGGTWGARDDAYIAHIETLLEKESERKVVVGSSLDDPTFTTPVQKKEKRKEWTGVFNAELESQWARDRAKKAAKKAEREQARLLAALEPLGAAQGKKKDKGASSKAMKAVGIVAMDARTFEGQLRRFVADGRRSVALPPMDKPTRKMVHAMAETFGIKSVSKGRGTGRYTTLVRTARTGQVKEGKLKTVMARFGRGGGKGKDKDGDKRTRQKEGEEVGKEAPKIGESNIGFRMLASMGWSEGGRIGGTGSVGIEAPLTAIVKHSKLGLGATRAS